MSRKLPAPSRAIVRLLLFLTVLMLTACGTAGHGVAAGLVAGPQVGIVANTQDTNVGREQDQVRALGIRLMREELRWSAVEPHRGRFDDRRYDALTADAARRGMRILPLLFTSPPWLAKQPNTLPRNLVAWKRFVRHVVGRYGPDGVFWRAHPELDGRLAMTTWEVWNEPYFTYFSRGGPDPAAYARLVRASIQAGREAHARVRFLAAMEIDYTAKGETTRNWAADVFAADPGLAAQLGGLAVHPYVPGSPLDATLPRPMQFRRILDILTAARRAGLTATHPLWITEIGWTTCPSCKATRTDQAVWFGDLFSMLSRRPLYDEVAAVVVFGLRDVGVPSASQSNYGIITADSAHKPAWEVVRRAARLGVAAG